MRGKLVISILTILAGVFILLTLSLRFSKFNEDLRVSAVKVISSELKHPVDIDKLVINLFPAYLDISGFRIKDETGKVLFSNKEARAYFSWADIILHKKVNLRQVSLESPELKIIREQDNKINLAPLFEELQRLIKEPSRHPYKLVMKELWVRGCSIGYEDRILNLKSETVKAGGRLQRQGERYEIIAWLDEGHLHASGAEEIIFKAKAALKVSEHGIHIDAISLSSLDSSISASGSVMEKERKPIFDGQWDARLNLSDLADISPQLKGISGSLSMKGAIGGALNALSVSGSMRGDIAVNSPELKSGLVLSGIKGRITADPTHLAVSDLSLAALKGRLQGAASLVKDATGKWGYSVGGTLEGGDLGALHGIFPAGNIPPVGGIISARAEISGSLKDVSSLKGAVDFSASPRISSTGGIQGKLLENIKTAQGKVHFSGREFLLEDIRISSPLYNAAISGTIGADNQLNLQTSCTVPDIMPLVSEAGYQKLTGKGTAGGTISGTIDAPVFKGRVAVENGTWNGVAVASAAGEISLSKERLSSQRIILRQGDGVYDFRGDILFNKEIFYDAAVRIKNGSPRQVTRIFYKDIPVDLPAGGELSFKGTAKSFSGEGHLSSSGGTVYGHPLENVSIQAILFTDRITFPDLTARRGQGRLKAAGEIDWNGAYQVNLAADNIDPSALDLTAIGSGKTRLPVHGTFAVKASGKGDFAHPRLSVELEAPDVRYDTIALGKAKFEGTIADGRVKGTVGLQDRRLLASVDAEMGSGKPWSLNAVLKDCSLDPLTKIFAEKTGALSVTTSGKATISGLGTDIPAIQATLELVSLKVDFEGYKAVNDGPLHLRVKGKNITFEDFRLKGQDTALEVVGNVVPGKEYSLLLRGTAEAHLIKTLTGRLEHASGNSDLVLSIEGTWDEPDVTGIFNLRDAQFKAKDLKYRLTDINAILIFNRDQVILHSLTGMAGGGSLSGTGNIELKHFVPDSIFLALSMKDIRYKYEDALTATLDMRLNYEKTSKGQSISGDVIIDHGRFYKRVDWKSAVLESRKKDADSMLKAEIPLKGRVIGFGEAALNIHCYNKEKFLIDNNLAKIPVSVDLYLRGTVNRPQLLGRLEATKGTVFMRGADYNITSAIVELSDPNRINPFFNITATTEVRDYRITMNLTGTPERFSANLHSDPPLKDIDVIGLLAVGRTGAEAKGEGGGVAAGEAMSFITGQVQNVLEDRVKRIVGFDRFQIDPYAGGAQSSGGARVTVGKRLLSDRLLVTYTAIMGSTDESVLTVEYKLAKDVSLVGNKDEKGRVKADLRYRFEFR